jgi:hypothetical protein
MPWHVNSATDVIADGRSAMELEELMDLGFEAVQEIDEQLERAEQVLYALRGRGLPMRVLRDAAR